MADDGKAATTLTLMVEASHGSPVAEKHLRPSAVHGSCIYHPFDIPDRRFFVSLCRSQKKNRTVPTLAAGEPSAVHTVQRLFSL